MANTQNRERLASRHTTNRFASHIFRLSFPRISFANSTKAYAIPHIVEAGAEAYNGHTHIINIIFIYCIYFVCIHIVHHVWLVGKHISDYFGRFLSFFHRVRLLRRPMCPTAPADDGTSRQNVKRSLLKVVEPQNPRTHHTHTHNTARCAHSRRLYTTYIVIYSFSIYSRDEIMAWRLKWQGNEIEIWQLHSRSFFLLRLVFLRLCSFLIIWFSKAVRASSLRT